MSEHGGWPQSQLIPFKHDNLIDDLIVLPRQLYHVHPSANHACSYPPSQSAIMMLLTFRWQVPCWLLKVCRSWSWLADMRFTESSGCMWPQCAGSSWLTRLATFVPKGALKGLRFHIMKCDPQSPLWNIMIFFRWPWLQAGWFSPALDTTSDQTIL